MIYCLRKWFLMLMLVLSAGPALAQPSRAYCEANLIAVNRAVESEVHRINEERRTAATAGTAIGCALISIGMLGLDFGLGTFICGAAAATVYAGMGRTEAAQISQRVYAQMRDRRCITAK